MENNLEKDSLSSVQKGELIGYARVSTKEQNVERQVRALEELGVDKIYIEKVSGKDTNRDELKKMMDYIREGDTVIVESYSRLARSTKDLLELIEEIESKGAKFRSLKENFDTSTPVGKLNLIMCAGLVQFEREMIRDRQKEGIAIAKEQGKYKGRAKKIVPDIEEWFELVEREQVSITYACKQMNIARSTYYYKYKEHLEQNEAIAEESDKKEKDEE